MSINEALKLPGFTIIQLTIETQTMHYKVRIVPSEIIKQGVSALKFVQYCVKTNNFNVISQFSSKKI